MSLKVIISEIPEEGLSVSETETPESLGFASDEIEGNVDLTATVHRGGEFVFFEGRLRTTLRLQCSRCVKEFLVPTECGFSGRGEPLPKDHPAEVELTRGDIDIHYYQGDLLDFNDIVREQIILLFPMQPLCGEGCKGLCPQCGRDLNEGSCDCVEPSTDPRWAALKKRFPRT